MDLEKKDNDLSEEESKSLQEYVSNGKPGLSRATDADIFKWFELYMSGKTYGEIAKITNSKRDLILYLSTRSNWYEKKMEYYGDISKGMTKKLTQARMDSLNTVTSAISALSKYYGDKFNKFISTNDSTIIETMDTKMLGQYYKSMEMLEKIVGEASGSAKKETSVNINVGAGATVKQVDDQTVEITEDIAGEMLRLLARKKKSMVESEED